MDRAHEARDPHARLAVQRRSNGDRLRFEGLHSCRGRHQQRNAILIRRPAAGVIFILTEATDGTNEQTSQRNVRTPPNRCAPDEGKRHPQAISTIRMKLRGGRTKFTKAVAAAMAPTSTIGSKRSGSSSAVRATLLVLRRRSRESGSLPKRRGFEQRSTGSQLRQQPRAFSIRRAVACSRSHTMPAAASTWMVAPPGSVKGFPGHSHVAPLQARTRRRHTSGTTAVPRRWPSSRASRRCSKSPARRR